MPSISEQIELHKQVKHFKYWADSIGQCCGEWECDYEYFHDLYISAVKTINVYCNGVIPTSIADDLIYALGRDNESEYIRNSLMTAPKLLTVLAKHVTNLNEHCIRAQYSFAII